MGCPYEVHCIIIVLFDAGAYREHIGIENDVLSREAYLLRQDSIGPFAHFDPPLKGVGLSPFVKGHYHHGRTVSAN